MREFLILEIFSGLGMGGAEKSFLNRYRYQNPFFRTIALNRRPDIDGWNFPPDLEVVTCSKSLYGSLQSFILLLRHLNPDVVIVRTPIDAIIASLSRIICRKSRFFLVFEAHSVVVSLNKFASLPITFLLKLIHKRIDLIFAVSKAVQLGPLCRGHNHVVVHYLGSDISLPNIDFSGLLSPRLLLLGRLIKSKQPDLLVRVLNDINSLFPLPNDFLSIVGTGPLFDPLTKMISDYDLRRVIKLYGNQFDITPFLLSHTHLVSCSTVEGLSLTFFEAKLAGLKIVSTPAGGGVEILDSHDIIVPDFEFNSIRHAIITVLESGVVAGSEREEIVKKAQWMKTSRTSKYYYQTLYSEVKKNQAQVENPPLV
jgi:glycosyltransferase involved in cell wall biosynthesis